MSEKPTKEEEGAGTTIGRNAAKTAAEPAAEAAGQTANLAAAKVTEGAVTSALAATPIAPVAPLIGEMVGDTVGKEVGGMVKKGVTNTAGELGAKAGGTVDDVAQFGGEKQKKSEEPKPHPIGSNNKKQEEQTQRPKTNSGSSIDSLGKQFENLADGFGGSPEVAEKLPEMTPTKGMTFRFDSKTNTDTGFSGIKQGIELQNLDDSTAALKARKAPKPP